MDKKKKKDMSTETIADKLGQNGNKSGIEITGQQKTPVNISGPKAPDTETLAPKEQKKMEEEVVLKDQKMQQMAEEI